MAIGLFGVIFLGLFGISRLINEYSNGGERYDGNQDVVGFVRIKGGIFDATSTVRNLTKLRRNPRVKSLLLRVDSPGGAVGPTQEIYREILRFRRSGRKVVASLGSVAASGGYYIALAADKIYSYPGTVTGSIGVVIVLPNAEKLLDTLGLRFTIIKSAPFKDIGSPLRKLTDSDRKIFQRLIDDTYRQFVMAVSKGRHMSFEKAKKIADGSVFSGERAKKLGLVDELGSQWDAAMEAARYANITGEPKLLEIKPRRSIWTLLNRSILDWFSGGSTSYLGGSPPMLQYMWR
jgi:protease-4